MIDRDLLARPMIRTALGTLAVSVGLVMWATVRALSEGPAVLAPPPMIDASTAFAAVARPASVDFDAAVEKDLFAVDRVEPESPYRLPGEDTAEEVAAAPKVEPPVPIVLGTAVIGEGRSFATVQLPDGPPVILRVGEKIGEYTVKSIERGRVVFTTPSKRVDVPAYKTGS